jgi:hypothetical protein
MSRKMLHSGASPTRVPLREPDRIIKYAKEGRYEMYLIRWKQSLLSGAMLNTSTDESTLLRAEAWKLRHHSSQKSLSPPCRPEEAYMYDVVWRDSWVAVSVVQDGRLISDFWTKRYQTRQR